MQLKSLGFALIVGALPLASCQKESDAASPATAALKYNALTPESTVIRYSTQPSTKVTAAATGDGLTYRWSASAGSILGSGQQVTYLASAGCCGGEQEITCTVADSHGQSQSKLVKIYVTR